MGLLIDAGVIGVLEHGNVFKQVKEPIKAPAGVMYRVSEGDYVKPTTPALLINHGKDFDMRTTLYIDEHVLATGKLHHSLDLHHQKVERAKHSSVY